MGFVSDGSSTRCRLIFFFFSWPLFSCCSIFTEYQATYFLRSEWNKVLAIYNTLLVAPPGRDASMSPRFMKPCCRCRVSPHETKSKMQNVPVSSTEYSQDMATHS